MSQDVKNIDGGDSGAVQNGTTVIRTARIASQIKQTLDSPRFSTYDISLFDSEGPVYSGRWDDPRYYQGDADE